MQRRFRILMFKMGSARPTSPILKLENGRGIAARAPSHAAVEPGLRPSLVPWATYL